MFQILWNNADVYKRNTKAWPDLILEEYTKLYVTFVVDRQGMQKYHEIVLPMENFE